MSNLEQTASVMRSSLRHAQRLINALGNPSEWQATGEVVDAGGHCACGHPIRWAFPIVHPDGRQNVIGSECVNHFQNINPDQADKLRAGLKVIADAIKGKINEANRIKQEAGMLDARNQWEIALEAAQDRAAAGDLLVAAALVPMLDPTSCWSRPIVLTVDGFAAETISLTGTASAQPVKDYGQYKRVENVFRLATDVLEARLAVADEAHAVLAVLTALIEAPVKAATKPAAKGAEKAAAPAKKKAPAKAATKKKPAAKAKPAAKK